MLGNLGRDYSATMAGLDCVDLSSSESDDSLFKEIDAYHSESPVRDSATSSYAWDSISWSMPSPSRGNAGPADSFTAADHDSVYLMNKDDMGNAWQSSKRAKRTLTTSLQLYDPSTGSSNVMEDNGWSQFLESQGKSHRSEKVTSAYSYASEPLQHRVIGEDRVALTDERLVFQAALKGLNQPKAEVTLPKGLLSVPLLRHQSIALAWMVKREKEGPDCFGGILADDQGLGKTISMIAIIQMHKTLQDKSKSMNLCSTKSESFCVDDDDSNASGVSVKMEQTVESDDLEVISEENNSSRAKFRKRKPAAGTLVVCPASVLRQWARELDEKVTDEAKLSVLLYHGSSRTRDAFELANYDVVLTTYAIVTNEVPKQPLVDEDGNDLSCGGRYGISSEFSVHKNSNKASAKKGQMRTKGFDNDECDPNSGAIARVHWFRVILDEAQTIKNHRTQVARACCSLLAKNRWCLSGTPIQNSIDELFSYFRFLKHEPYSKYKSFFEAIKIPILRDMSRGYAKLQLILRSIMLRRTKGTLIDGQPIISLPPKDIKLNKVEFSAEERAFYSKLEAASRSQFKAYAAAGTVNQNYASLLLMLLRLRQACNHPLLVKGVSPVLVERETMGNATGLSKEKLRSLLKLLETPLALCSECNDLPEDAVVTICGHVFCFQCVSNYLTGEDNTCPEFKCKEQLNADVIFSKTALRKILFGIDSNHPSNLLGFAENSSLLKEDYCSTKIKAALEILCSFCKPKASADVNYKAPCRGDSSSSEVRCPESDNSKPIKALVFSQWAGMLDLVEVSLKKTGVIYRRFDGAMTLAARDKAVKEFNTNPKVRVMLMSLKAGNLGLNLVAACHVILLDLWWNPTAEDQAIDRAHRIGQTRPVIVSRLTIKDTVEDRILALQEEKRKMVASAFGEDKSGTFAARLNMEDLKYLFGV